MPLNPLEYLCMYDQRNPDFYNHYDDDEEKPVPRLNCACDNCFYGKDKLAVEIIRLQEELDNVAKTN